MTSYFGPFNPRVVKVGVEINGVVKYYQDLDIRIQGQKFWSATSAFCSIRLSNMTREERNWLLTHASPIAGNGQQPAKITVDVGREIGNLFRLFEGSCWASTVTMPPDIGIVFRTTDGSALLSDLRPNSFGPLTLLSTLSQYVAKVNGYVLDYKVTTDIQIANVSPTINVQEFVDYLNSLGGIKAAADTGILCVRDINGFREDRSFILSQETGMVGMPQACQQGCIAQMLVSGDVQVGDRINVKSVKNPSVDGFYRVDQIAFDIANRDNPFFYTLTLTSRFAQGSPVQ